MLQTRSGPIAYDTLVAARDAIRAKKISSVELTRQALDRIAKLDPTILAFNETYADRAMARNEHADGVRSAGGTHGANGFRRTDGLGDLRVGSCLPARYRHES